MPTMFCPGCGKSLSAEQKATGYCPGCGLPLPGVRATDVPPPRPAPRPREQAPRVEEEEAGVSRSVLGWGTVRAGLGQTVVGAILSALGLLVAYAVGMTATDGGGTSALPVVVLFLALTTAGVGVIVALAGAFLGCAAPQESGARGWAVACSVLLALTFVSGVVFRLGTQERADAVQRDIRFGQRVDRVAPIWGPEELRAIFYLGCGGFLLAQVCYLLFLRAVASFFNRDALALGVACYLAFSLLLSAGTVLFLTGTLEAGSLPVRGVSLLYVLIAVTVTMSVWGVVLVGQVRGAVTRGIVKS